LLFVLIENRRKSLYLDLRLDSYGTSQSYAMVIAGWILLQLEEEKSNHCHYGLSCCKNYAKNKKHSKFDILIFDIYL